MDCYTEKAAKVLKYKNPINDVGVTTVYGYDNPEGLAETSGMVFVGEHNMTPQKYIDELHGIERTVFKNLFAGRIAISFSTHFTNILCIPPTLYASKDPSFMDNKSTTVISKNFKRQ